MNPDVRDLGLCFELAEVTTMMLWQRLTTATAPACHSAHLSRLSTQKGRQGRFNRWPLLPVISPCSPRRIPALGLTEAVLEPHSVEMLPMGLASGLSLLGLPTWLMCEWSLDQRVVPLVYAREYGMSYIHWMWPRLSQSWFLSGPSPTHITLFCLSGYPLMLENF